MSSSQVKLARTHLNGQSVKTTSRVEEGLDETIREPLEMGKTNIARGLFSLYEKQRTFGLSGGKDTEKEVDKNSLRNKEKIMKKTKGS